MDALQAERDQNITIDTSQIWFSTDRRDYVIIDAPGPQRVPQEHGHRSGPRRGRSAADRRRTKGVQEQSRRHATMLSLLGLEQLVVVVNKMDLVDYDADPLR